MRKYLMLGGDNMAEVFGDLLARAGGMFKPVKLDPPTEAEKAKKLEREKLRADMRPVMREPKWTKVRRDKSISARQWKKQNKAAKRFAKQA